LKILFLKQMEGIEVDEEILLRTIRLSDVAELKNSLLTDEDRVSEFIQINSTGNYEHLRRFIEECGTATSERSGLYLGIFVHGTFAGQIRAKLSKLDGHDKSDDGFVCNIAYWVRWSFSGRGLTYRCLRSVIPFITSAFWEDRKIVLFEAEIHIDNPASQAVVRRLGFQCVIPNDCKTRALELIAPHSTVRWILPFSGDIKLTLEEAGRVYHSDKSSNEPERKLYLEVISILSSLGQDEPTTMGTSVSFSEAKKLTSLIKPLEDELHSRLVTCGPGRVARDDCRGLSWIGTADLDGLWTEENSGVVAWGHKVVKGSQQQFSKSPTGEVNIGGFILESTTQNRVVFRNRETDSTIEWIGIELPNSRDCLLDGIWQTPRGYVGVIGSTLVNSASLWCIEISMIDVFLVISQSCKLRLDYIDSEHVLWKPIEYPRRRRRMFSRILFSMSWTREKSPICDSILRAVELKSRMSMLSALMLRRSAEVDILDKLFPSTRPLKESENSPGYEDDLLSRVQELIEDSRLKLRLMEYVSIIRTALRSVDVCGLEDKVNILLATLLEYSRLPSVTELKCLLRCLNFKGFFTVNTSECM
jgi:RimJ/RimL family protein N-acetyltransferase